MFRAFLKFVYLQPLDFEELLAMGRGVRRGRGAASGRVRAGATTVRVCGVLQGVFDSSYGIPGCSWSVAVNKFY